MHILLSGFVDIPFPAVSYWLIDDITTFHPINLSIEELS